MVLGLFSVWLVEDLIACVLITLLYCFLSCNWGNWCNWFLLLLLLLLIFFLLQKFFAIIFFTECMELVSFQKFKLMIDSEVITNEGFFFFFL